MACWLPGASIYRLHWFLQQVLPTEQQASGNGADAAPCHCRGLSRHWKPLPGLEAWRSSRLRLLGTW